jgi:hypothetical protein
MVKCIGYWVNDFFDDWKFRQENGVDDPGDCKIEHCRAA